MAEEQNPLTADQAYSELYNRIHAPAFLTKLAQDYGIHPQTEQEALDLLTMGGQLQQAFQSPQNKQASDQSQFGQFVEELGGQSGQPNAQRDAQIKAASIEAAQIPHFANCVLTMQKSAAEQLAAQGAAA